MSNEAPDTATDSLLVTSPSRHNHTGYPTATMPHWFNDGSGPTRTACTGNRRSAAACWATTCGDTPAPALGVNAGAGTRIGPPLSPFPCTP